jgi:F0F1-type ATP synthase membrane subunit a
VPVMMFELFMGFVQAAIFALLTLFFIKIAITEPH